MLDLLYIPQVAHCYPEDMKNYPQEIKDMLHTQSSTLDRTMRMVTCAEPENFFRGGGPENFFSHQCILQSPTDLPREAIGPLGVQLLLEGVHTRISKETYSHL